MTEQPAEGTPPQPNEQNPAEPLPAESPPAEPPPAARTGVSAADAAADRLGEVEAAPLDEHVEIYEDVHRRLQEGLADLDEQ